MTEPVNFTLPKKPRIYKKDAPPDQRKIAVMPLKALTDQTLTDGSIRILGVLCSYCNRAGLTWVSQKRLSEDMKTSRQNITNQLAKLRDAGYVEIVRKGFRGERCNTLRVIFDPIEICISCVQLDLIRYSAVRIVYTEVLHIECWRWIPDCIVEIQLLTEGRQSCVLTVTLEDNIEVLPQIAARLEHSTFKPRVEPT